MFVSTLAVLKKIKYEIIFNSNVVMESGGIPSPPPDLILTLGGGGGAFPPLPVKEIGNPV